VRSFVSVLPTLPVIPTTLTEERARRAAATRPRAGTVASTMTDARGAFRNDAHVLDDHERCASIERVADERVAADRHERDPGRDPARVVRDPAGGPRRVADDVSSAEPGDVAGDQSRHDVSRIASRMTVASSNGIVRSANC
jgi:hypothetical protein